MIHFFITFSNDVSRTPFGQALEMLGIDYRVFQTRIEFRYRSRAKLYLKLLPQLARFSIFAAVKSLIFSHPRPTTIVAGSDIEVLFIILVRFLLFRRGVHIIFLGFIFTTRSSSLLNYLRIVYYRVILASCDAVIVHSRIEPQRYSVLFNLPSTLFHFVPWGTDIRENPELEKRQERSSRALDHHRIVSAGRSDRDYRTLSIAVADIGIETHIICDSSDAIRSIVDCDQIQILRSCYGADYIDEIQAATIVAIPLLSSNISSGQMVLLQSMCLGKAIVASDVAAISEYVTHEKEALLVPKGDPVAMKQAIERLLSDRVLRQSLGINAMRRHGQEYSTVAHLRQIVAIAPRNS